MRPFEHFGLKRPPFEMKPDPRFFLESPSHMETLATLQYTIYAGKACSVVAGESGSGKTLLARVISNASSRKSDILWVDAVGQTADCTEATLYRAAPADSEQTRVTESETTLAEWTRSSERRRSRTLLIVDDADALAVRGWRDILQLLTRDARNPHPASIVLLGLPKLIEILSRSDMTRIRRRVFRICTLSLLNRDQVAGYLHCRISAAGGENDEMFTTEAIDAIYRCSGGNPALINQLCDNAIVSVFGDGHDRIDVGDIMNSLRSTLCVRRPLLAEPAVGQRLLGAPLADEYSPPLDAEIEIDPELSAATFAADGANGDAQSGIDPPVRVVQSVEMKSSPAGGAIAFGSLRALESRVTRALRTVRSARSLTDGFLNRRAAEPIVDARTIVEGLTPDTESTTVVTS